MTRDVLPDPMTLTVVLLVNEARASALGKPVTSSQTLPGLLEFLQNKKMLVVLDNCEHLIDAAADLATPAAQPR